jgi:glycosyltransferase involved in cell wall biosynthesis
VRAFYAPSDYEARRCRSLPELLPLHRWLSARLRSFEPDVVHAHLFHASVLVASIRRPPQARLILSHQHGDHFQAIGSPVKELADRLAGRRYDLIVGCSRSVRTHLINHYGYAPGRVRFIHNGWEGHPLPRNGTDRSVLCVARFRAQKNHRMLVDAVSQVREDVPDVRLRLAGDGETRAEIEEYVNRLDMQRTVDFLGTTSDVWPLLASARVFSLPSHYEPLGIAALEAMAAGVPVVATAVGGLPEIVHDGRTGFLVSPNSSIELADRLRRLLTDDRLAEEMGIRAQEAAQQFRSEQMASRYAELYAEMVEEAHV